MKRDPNSVELQALLDLDGVIFWPNPRYWVKFEAKIVESTPQIPHGIRYSLTLHDRNNTRLLGFDNAHSVKKQVKRRRKFLGRIVKWDHIHHFEKITPYGFESASQLIDDFWKAVDEIIK